MVVAGSPARASRRWRMGRRASDRRGAAEPPAGLAEQLVAAARAQWLALTGPGGVTTPPDQQNNARASAAFHTGYQWDRVAQRPIPPSSPPPRAVPDPAERNNAPEVHPHDLETGCTRVGYWLTTARGAAGPGGTQVRRRGRDRADTRVSRAGGRFRAGTRTGGPARCRCFGPAPARGAASSSGRGLASGPGSDGVAAPASEPRPPRTGTGPARTSRRRSRGRTPCRARRGRPGPDAAGSPFRSSRSSTPTARHRPGRTTPARRPPSRPGGTC